MKTKMDTGAIAVYRRLRILRNFILVLFLLSFIGSFACFAFLEITYGSILSAGSPYANRHEEVQQQEGASSPAAAENGKSEPADETRVVSAEKTEIPAAANAGPETEALINGTETEVPAEDKKSEGLDLSKALFIGNSITEGLHRWGDAQEATFFSVEGLNVNSYFTTDKFKLNNRTITPDEAVGEGSYEKIFLMFGINELGWKSKEAFINRYGAVIRSIKEKQPEAEIYVQSIIYVTEKKSAKDKLFTNKNIEGMNKKIKKMAKENGAEYIDLNKGLCNGNKYLPSEASGDGIHLNPGYCKKWKNYLIEYFNN